MARLAHSLESIVSTSQDRNEAIWRAYAIVACSVTEIGHAFGVRVLAAIRIARNMMQS